MVVVVAAGAARVAAPAQRPVRFSAALACGVERWNIKTLKDRPLLLRARATTVAHLTGLPRPSYLPPSRRLLAEDQVIGYECGNVERVGVTGGEGAAAGAQRVPGSYNLNIRLTCATEGCNARNGGFGSCAQQRCAGWVRLDGQRHHAAAGLAPQSA